MSIHYHPAVLRETEKLLIALGQGVEALHEISEGNLQLLEACRVQLEKNGKKINGYEAVQELYHSLGVLLQDSQVVAIENYRAALFPAKYAKHPLVTFGEKQP